MGPLTRLFRDRLSTISVAIAILAVAASTLLQSQASAQLAGALNTNWRGAYDILVRPKSQDLGAGDTQGFVESNFVAATGSGGISLADLSRIRNVAGVEVAAPIGLVGRIGYDRAAVTVEIPSAGRTGGSSVLPAAPTLYRLQYDLKLTDASGTRTVDSQQMTGVFRAPNSDPDRSIFRSDGSSNSSTGPEGTSISGPKLPNFSSSVIAVDPQAEKELLGGKGDFLDPLTKVGSGPRALGQVVNQSWFLAANTEFPSAIGLAQSRAMNDGGLSTAIPLLVNSTPQSKMTMEVSLSKSETRVKSWPTMAQEVQAAAEKATFAPVDMQNKDLTNLLVPFATGNLAVPWPGTSNAQGEVENFGAGGLLSPLLVGRPRYDTRIPPTAGDAATPSFTVQPDGLVSIDGGGPPASPGAGVQSYRKASATDGSDPLASTTNIPVGSFTRADLPSDDGSASYTPYGAYDPAITTPLSSTGEAFSGPPVVANSSGLDFISPLPGAITDLEGATALRGSAPIDAVRVRVAGISNYTPEATATVTQIAAELQAMDFEVSVVAGASPQQVNIYVPSYKVGPTGATADLGWVSQDWTTLGAAVLVAGTVTSLSTTLLIVALIVTLLSLLAAVWANRDSRRQEAEVLSNLGWGSSKIVKWVIGPHAIATVLIVVCGITTITLAGFSGPAVLAASLAVGIAVLGLLVITFDLRPRSAKHPRSRSRLKASILTAQKLGLSRLVAHPGTVVGRSLSWTVVSVGAALMVTALLQANNRIGKTRLAGITIDKTAAVQLGLVALTLIAGWTLAALAQRVDGASTRQQRQTLTQAGWAPSDLRKMALSQTGVIAGLAVIMTAVSLAVLAVQDGSTWAASAVAALSALVVCSSLSVRGDFQESKR